MGKAGCAALEALPWCRARSSGAALGLPLISAATSQTQHCPTLPAIINSAPRPAGPAGASAPAARAPALPGGIIFPRAEEEHSLQPQERAGCRRPRNVSLACSSGCWCCGHSELCDSNQAWSLGPEGSQTEMLGFGKAPRAAPCARERLWLPEKGGKLVPSSPRGCLD